MNWLRIISIAVLTASLCPIVSAAPTTKKASSHDGPPDMHELNIGDAAPDFSLPGIDGKTHTLADYKSAKILIIVFTCDHCPTAQLYESRLKKLVSDYK